MLFCWSLAQDFRNPDCQLPRGKDCNLQGKLCCYVSPWPKILNPDCQLLRGKRLQYSRKTRELKIWHRKALLWCINTKYFTCLPAFLTRDKSCSRTLIAQQLHPKIIALPKTLWDSAHNSSWKLTLYISSIIASIRQIIFPHKRSGIKSLLCLPTILNSTTSFLNVHLMISMTKQ